MTRTHRFDTVTGLHNVGDLARRLHLLNEAREFDGLGSFVSGRPAEL